MLIYILYSFKKNAFSAIFLCFWFNIKKWEGGAALPSGGGAAGLLIAETATETATATGTETASATIVAAAARATAMAADARALETERRSQPQTPKWRLLWRQRVLPLLH